ncbi:MAG: cobyrinate a,c-diamide synthase [Rhodocyclales bacterium]|nr:cobyrinate a,c-diamide synthase [Rhodocyclales bacterium]
MHRFLISAALKSSGKTTISIGLAAALRARGHVVQPFKKGPDYIDPLWLTRAAGRDCHNLDFQVSPDDELRGQFARHGCDADVCLVEGNMGLYDGLDLAGSNSNAALAKLLALPVILVLDARGMTRGIAPLILGYQAFDREIKIAGVILNKLGGKRHEAKLRASVEHYTDVPVIGAVQDDPRLQLVERHLGLMPANEAQAAQRRIAEIAAAVAEQVDIERLLAATQTAVSLPRPAPQVIAGGPTVRIAVAQDAAFGFYYADDFDALRAAGAEIVPFDTLRDARLPVCDGLFIGGGFPESFLDDLAANASLRADIFAAIENGLPTYAECGGLMYLARSIEWNGKTAPMVGAIAGDVVMHKKPVGRGYVTLRPTTAHPWRGGEAAGDLRAHEFHYSSLDNLPADTRYAYEMIRGHGIDGRRDGIVYKNLLASYSHLRAAASCDWPARFVGFVRTCGHLTKEEHRCSA